MTQGIHVGGCGCGIMCCCSCRPTRYLKKSFVWRSRRQVQRSLPWRMMRKKCSLKEVLIMRSSFKKVGDEK